MMWVLRRNEVKLVGERLIDFDMFNVQKATQKDGVFGDLVEEMYDFCNDNCKGIWTYTYSTEYHDESAKSSHFHGLHQVKMTGTMRVYFELRDDRDAFMKNHILLTKLSQE
jgi:hypothetical protein